MAVTWGTPTISPAMQIQGPALVYYGAYTAAGVDASSTTFVGVMSAKDGVEWAIKQNFNRTEIQQSTYPLNSFLTKNDASFKFTVSHAQPSIMNVLLGQQASSYTAGAMAADQNFQNFVDPWDASSSTGVPSMRPVYRQILIRFPNPGYDTSTTPIGGFSYLQIWKGYFTPAGSPKIGRDNLFELPVTVNFEIDPTVSVPEAYQWVTIKP